MMELLIIYIFILVPRVIVAREQDSGSFCSSQRELCKCDLRTFKRNPLDKPNASESILKSLLNVCCQPDILKLHFSGLAITNIPKDIFNNFPCHAVQDLIIENTGISVLPKNGSAFIGLPNLKRLSIVYNTKLISYSEAAFSGLGLTELKLNGNPVSSISNRAFNGMLGGLNHLKVLDMSNNRINNVKSHAFRNFKGGKQGLQKLFLNDNQLTSIDPQLFEGLESLQELSLLNNPIKKIIGGSFLQLRDLTTLSISGSFGDQKSQEMSTLTQAMLHGLVNLKSLTLVGLGLKKLAIDSLVDLRQLEELNLSKNKFQEIPKEALERLGMTSVGKLTFLNISDNDIGCITNEAFQTLMNLEEIDLSNNLITAVSDKAFIGLNKLEVIHLNGNPIRLMSPRAFVYLKQLETLKIDTIMSSALKGVRERFQSTALGHLSKETEVKGLENMGIQHGGGARLKNSRSRGSIMPDSECPMNGIAGVDFTWKRSHVASEDMLYLDGTYTKPSTAKDASTDQVTKSTDKSTRLQPSTKDGGLHKGKAKKSNLSIMQLLDSKKYLVISLACVLIIIILILGGIIIVYRVVARRKSDPRGNGSRRGLANSEYGGSTAPKTCSETAYSNQYGYYCTNKKCSLPCCEYHGQSTTGSKSPLNFSLCTSNQGAAKMSKKMCDNEIIPAAALQLAPPPYPQHARLPYAFQFGSTGSSSSASGTLVSNQKLSSGAVCNAATAGTLGSNGSATEPLLFSSPRTKSGSTDHTNMTPCTNSSLEASGLAANMCIFPPSPSSMHPEGLGGAQSPPSSLPGNSSCASNGNSAPGMNTCMNPNGSPCVSMAQTPASRLITNLGVL